MPLLTPPLPAGYAVAQTMPLKEPLALSAPVTVTIEAPIGPDAYMGSKPVRVCFTRPSTPRADCQPIQNDGYPFQSFESAGVELLSRRTGQRALIVRASYSGGSHRMMRTVVFAPAGPDFLPMFSSNLGDTGDEQRFSEGPLDGYFISADFAFTRPSETWWDPHRYSVKVNHVTPDGGYLQVLQYLTSKTYPAEREGPHEVVQGEFATIRRLLKTVYPAGPPP